MRLQKEELRYGIYLELQGSMKDSLWDKHPPLTNEIANLKYGWCLEVSINK